MQSKVSLSIVLLSVLVGCSPLTVRPPQPSVTPYHEERAKNYQIGQRQAVSVGDPLIKRKSYFARDITLHDRAKPDHDFDAKCSIPLNSEFQYHGTSGIELPVFGSTNVDGQQYQVVLLGSSNRGLRIGMLVDASTGVATGAGVWRNGYGTWVANGATFNFSQPLPVFSFPKRTEIDKQRSFENVELVYTGISGKSITLLYREYTPEDLVRPAFSQNLSYDIGASDIIAFKSFHVRIVSATNEGLEYMVLSE